MMLEQARTEMLRAHAHRVDEFWNELSDLYELVNRRDRKLRKRISKLMDVVGNHVVDTLSLAFDELRIEQSAIREEIKR